MTHRMSLAVAAEREAICTARDGSIRCERAAGHGAPHMALLPTYPPEAHRWTDGAADAERDAAVRALLRAACALWRDPTVTEGDDRPGDPRWHALLDAIGAVRRFYPEAT